jgi:predicted nucleic acid-binding protein
MMTVAVEPIFLDTNILVYASVDTSPFYSQVRAVITAHELAGTPLWISRQIIREYLATLARPHVGIPMTVLTATVRQFEVRFQMVDEGPAVTAQLLTLLEQGYSAQVYDTNIIATMQTIGIRRILTNNPGDFMPFASFITVIPLQ